METVIRLFRISARGQLGAEGCLQLSSGAEIVLQVVFYQLHHQNGSSKGWRSDRSFSAVALHMQPPPSGGFVLVHLWRRAVNLPLMSSTENIADISGCQLADWAV